MFSTRQTVAVEASRPRRSSQLSPEQIRRRRNEDWLNDHEVGRRDPVTGQVKTRKVKLIAQLYGVTEQTVRNGISEARRLRERIVAST